MAASNKAEKRKLENDSNGETKEKEPKKLHLDVFDHPDELSSITFLVEDKDIHFNKDLLSLASPVFHAMFHGHFKEKNLDKIPLPGKRHEDMVQFFTLIHPKFKTILSGKLIM